MLAIKNNKTQFYNDYDKLQNIKAHDTIQGHNVYFRPGRTEFLDFLFMQNQNLFEIGVWSSLDKEKTQLLTQSFFGRHYRNLLFVSATRREEYEGVQSSYNFNPLPIKRDLKLVFDRFQDFEHNNTIVFSNFPNQSEEYRINDVIMPQYDPTKLGSNFEIDFALPGVMKYLRGLKFFIFKKGMIDVRPMLATKSYQFLLDRVTNTGLNYNTYN
ncbi:HAD-like domain [Pseudocohnilembus persalinus]|uniref:HAD-like domain n=1 Tax=Pseudocohnilembus persalinus TaxID=266149 RepID=A0A0V0QKE6_PSEPJ|nr:HAD-like domain [Pseudocohnilembus persalinus]|eukprot:KRX02718.1 HAD-like domain [Pseudocohnilembus persalinus]